MKRSTARWTTAFAAAALIGLPAAGFAQTPASSSPQQPPASQTQQPPTTSSSQPTTPSQTSDTATSPADHVREAKQALSSIPQSSIPAKDRVKFTQLRTHLNNLERDINVSSASKTAASARAKSAGAARWGTEVAAIDKILTDLVGPDTSASSMTSGTAGTEAAGTSGRTRAGARATTLDDAAKDKLREVRRHVTELASAMSGTSPQAAQSAQPTPPTAPTAPTMKATPTEPSSATPSQTPQTGIPTATGAQPAATAPQPPAQVDAAAAKQHLSEARDSLSQLTALPEASKLQGETRTQVSQLISNFNELLATQADWKAAYAKVDANLNALLGPDTSAPSEMRGTATGTTGTAGAAAPTGTTGAAAAGASVQVDPAIRAKLVDFRTHLKEFAKAAGGK